MMMERSLWCLVVRGLVRSNQVMEEELAVGWWLAQLVVLLVVVSCGRSFPSLAIDRISR